MMGFEMKEERAVPLSLRKCQIEVYQEPSQHSTKTLHEHTVCSASFDDETRSLRPMSTCRVLRPSAQS